MRAQVTLEVFTFKAGVLSSVAHDLRLSIADVTVDIEDSQVTVDVDLARLRVDGAMKHGRLDGSALGAADRKKILSNALSDVLETRRYPRARFSAVLPGEAQPAHVTGQLTLRDRSIAVRVDLQYTGDDALVRAELRPSQFGIAPFTALLGAIKLQDRVVVQACVPRLTAAPTT